MLLYELNEILNVTQSVIVNIFKLGTYIPYVFNLILATNGQC